MSRIKFMNTEIDNLTMEELLTSINTLIMANKAGYVVTPNVDHIIKLETDYELKEIYKNADLIIADGKPLIWISKLYGIPIKEKLSGSDLFPLLCKMSAEKGYKIFFLGAGESVAKKAAKNLKIRYTGLQIAGTYSPPMGFEKKEEEVTKIVKLIQNAKPHILIVALGCPKQEKFIYKFKSELNVPISLGLGASLDFEAGNIKRAPKWMRDYGFEWFYRFLQEPKRMFKRYFVDDIKILGLIKKYK